jgi:hypothetical protein
MRFCPKSSGSDRPGAPACDTRGAWAASRRRPAAHHAAGHPQNRSFNHAPPYDQGISPVARCSNAFTPHEKPGEHHGR